MHRPKSNTSLDERALTEAAKALQETARSWRRTVPDSGVAPELAKAAITTYLTALSEPPLDEWLKGEIEEATQRLTKAEKKWGEESMAYHYWDGRLKALKDVLEALVESRRSR